MGYSVRVLAEKLARAEAEVAAIREEVASRAGEVDPEPAPKAPKGK